jgi:phosphotransferase system  glucose/maltose/N-acetylglucosamine-specific IIC component
MLTAVAILLTALGLLFACAAGARASKKDRASAGIGVIISAALLVAALLVRP